MRLTQLLPLFALLPLTACKSEPTELVPLFSTIAQLPGLPDGQQGTFDMTLSNSGEKDVTISSLTFTALAGREGEESSFSNPQTDLDVVPPLDQVVLRFNYETPGGAEQAAVLVIESDAEVNPTLEIEVYTESYLTPSAPDGGTPAPDAGATTDAGVTTDAGGAPPDAGTPASDAGATTDAGVTTDAGATSSDAGATTDAGTTATDAG